MAPPLEVVSRVKAPPRIGERTNGCAAFEYVACAAAAVAAAAVRLSASIDMASSCMRWGFSSNPTDVEPGGGGGGCCCCG